MKKIADVKQCANMVNVRVKRESQVPSWFESVVEEEETKQKPGKSESTGVWQLGGGRFDTVLPGGRRQEAWRE